MKIYTRTGDDGESSLWRGGRVPKDAPRLAAYGSIDEVVSVLGLALALLPDGGSDEVCDELRAIQRDLFAVGSALATAGGEAPPWPLAAERIAALEVAIDRMEAELPPLDRFLLPGGAPAGAALHVARTVCRRAEREIVAVHRADPLPETVLRYVNRLSDYLFVAARRVNQMLGRPEPPLEL